MKSNMLRITSSRTINAMVPVLTVELIMKSSPFNYTSATYTSFNHSSIKNDIVYDRPVIIYGEDEYDPDDKHTWVCNGYKEYIYYDDDCNSWSSMSYHMVWDNGTVDNGWYNYGSFNAGGYYLNENLNMIYNINP